MRRRFTLSQLMLAIAAVAIEFGLLPTPVAVVAACLTLVMPLVMFPRSWAGRALVVATVPVLVAGLVLPLLVQPRVNSRSSHCASNLRQVALALLQYERQNGSFPPAYVADAGGTPLYSWRVLILPYLDQQDVYNAFNFGEPWDSPANLPVSNTMIRIFACPEETGIPCETNYLVVKGPGTVFPSGMTVAERNLRDGPSATILLAEVANSNVRWAEPVDLDISTMSLKANDKTRPGISTSGASGRPAVAFADGHVRRLSDSLPPETLRALLTIGGGEKVDMSELDR